MLLFFLFHEFNCRRLCRLGCLLKAEAVLIGEACMVAWILWAAWCILVFYFVSYLIGKMHHYLELAESGQLNLARSIYTAWLHFPWACIYAWYSFLFSI